MRGYRVGEGYDVKEQKPFWYPEIKFKGVWLKILEEGEWVRFETEEACKVWIKGEDDE